MVGNVIRTVAMTTILMLMTETMIAKLYFGFLLYYFIELRGVQPAATISSERLCDQSKGNHFLLVILF